jgi:hypothetical protein
MKWRPQTKYFSNNDLLHFQVESANEKFEMKNGKSVLRPLAKEHKNGEQAFTPVPLLPSFPFSSAAGPSLTVGLLLGTLEPSLTVGAAAWYCSQEFNGK